MYWYRFKLIWCVCLLFAATGCGGNTQRDKGQLKYFDLKKYFNEEALRLAKKYPRIKKTVSYNGQAETKTVAIKHWDQELNSFIESDINKPAWKESYIVYQYKDGLTYQSVDSTLHTQRIVIAMKHDKVTRVRVVNFTHNMLYETNEYLDYHPDSLYYIEKNQSVRVLGDNQYQITGKFK